MTKLEGVSIVQSAVLGHEGGLKIAPDLPHPPAPSPPGGEGETNGEQVPSPSHGDVCAAYAGL
jgi:hypothetical protein